MVKTDSQRIKDLEEDVAVLAELVCKTDHSQQITKAKDEVAIFVEGDCYIETEHINTDYQEGLEKLREKEDGDSEDSDSHAKKKSSPPLLPLLFFVSGKSSPSHLPPHLLWLAVVRRIPSGVFPT